MKKKKEKKDKIEFLFSFKRPDHIGPSFGEFWQIFGFWMSARCAAKDVYS